MLSFSFQSHLIKHSDMGRTFKDSQRAFEHLRHSESTRALGHSEGTQRALGGHSEGTRALKALGHSGTQALKTLRHSGTWALKALRHLSTRVLEHLGHLSTQALGHSRRFI